MDSRRRPKVIVGISGGVDSAVAALLLKDAGYAVEGLHMTNWDSEDDFCPAAQDYQDARSVSAELGIVLHWVSFAREYREKVFLDFLAELQRGRTPNPDIACNREIKFGDCLRYAQRLGADFVATGHYAQLRVHDGESRLYKGRDRKKDQSYFLASVHKAAFANVLFPLGALDKPEVRRIANDRGLPNHGRKDSTGICFIGERPFQSFLQGFLPPTPGNIVTPEGEQLGQHTGLMYYTLGQRQGLNIGGQRDHGDEPWYVAAKDLQRNQLVVVQGRDHPLLWNDSLKSAAVHWLRPPASDRFECAAKTRYRQEEVPCNVRLLPDGEALVLFRQPVWAITPGQQVVFYAGAECLGSATIEAAGNLAGAPAVSHVNHRAASAQITAFGYNRAP